MTKWWVLFILFQSVSRCCTCLANNNATHFFGIFFWLISHQQTNDDLVGSRLQVLSRRRMRHTWRVPSSRLPTAMPLPVRVQRFQDDGRTWCGAPGVLERCPEQVACCPFIRESWGQGSWQQALQQRQGIPLSSPIMPTVPSQMLLHLLVGISVRDDQVVSVIYSISICFTMFHNVALALQIIMLLISFAFSFKYHLNFKAHFIASLISLPVARIWFIHLAFSAGFWSSLAMYLAGSDLGWSKSEFDQYLFICLSTFLVILHQLLARC